jgi:hypothetical protein
MQTEFKKPSIDEAVTALPMRRVPQKRWKLFRSDNQDPARRTRNIVIDMAYMHLLSKVKAFYQGTGTEAYEQDLRHDRTFTAVGMHCFCTPELYLELECGYDLLCIVRYDFEHCRHQAQIMSLLEGIYPLKDVARHCPTKGGLVQSFAAIKRLHPPEYFTHL